MKRIVVISTNNNPDYYVYCPYIVKAWRTHGWEVAVMMTHDVEEKLEADYLIRLPKINDLRSETIAQAGRLYAANYLPLDSLIMTSDMDLLPLQNYWNPQPNDITNYGRDLTDYTFFPMGYTAMSCDNWKKIMNLTYNTEENLLRDARELGTPFKEDWESWWNFDWELLTKRLNKYSRDGGELKLIMRGRRAGSCFAYGRVDRGDSMQIPEGELIDAHLENHNTRHPDKWGKFITLYNKYYGEI